MFQTLDEDLPPMSTEILKLRLALMNAEGIHLTYNVPRSADGADRFGPIAPFAGLCIAVLIYLPKEITGSGFHVLIGSDPKHYVIGWNMDKDWGLHSVTYAAGIGGGYEGKRIKTVKKFPKGYSYLYFYFKNSNTMHGWINDTHDLGDDTVHPYLVSEVGKRIRVRQFQPEDIKYLEIHWVAWGSSHNLKGAPSSTMVDHLFPKTNRGMVDFKDSDVFEMRTGTMVTVRTKYKKTAGSKKIGVIIGVGCATCTNKNFTARAFPECTDAKEVYTFRVTLTEKGALIHKNERGVSYNIMPSYDALHVKCRQYLTFDNVKLVHIHVETMGQTWV